MATVPKHKQIKCKKCGQFKIMFVHQAVNKTYHACGCQEIVNPSMPKIGRIEYSDDHCRWLYLDQNEVIIDCTTYKPYHKKYFQEFHTAEPERLDIVRRNLEQHAKRFDIKNQWKGLYGRTPRKKGMYLNQPCFIVGSGPSLANSAPLLTDAPGPILSINSSIKLLPYCDWWLEGDYLWDVDQWFGGNAPRKPREGAIFFGGTHESVLRYDWGRNVYFNFNNMGDPATSTSAMVREKIPDALEFVNGYESMFTALHIAYMWGCNPIVLVGADHAFIDEYHAGEENKNPKPHQRQFLIDNTGQLKQTTNELLTTALYIELEATFLNLAGVAVINCSEGIIKNRVASMQLEKFLSEYKNGVTLSTAANFSMSQDGQHTQMLSEYIAHPIGERFKSTMFDPKLMTTMGGSHGPVWNGKKWWGGNGGSKLTDKGKKSAIQKRSTKT